MPSKIKNIIIFIVILVIVVSVYLFFFKSKPEVPALSSAVEGSLTGLNVSSDTTYADVGQEFLALLLNVKNIHLNDGIFTDPAFATLHDSSIVLIPEGNEGRANPFAPIGVDQVLPASVTPPPLPPITDTGTPPSGGGGSGLQP